MSRSPSFPLLPLLLLLLHPGPVVSQDAEDLYQDACEAGDLSACNVFGLMLEHGRGVSRDLPRAAGLYERACQGGLLVGCTNVGLLYEAGAGVPRDVDRATGFFQVACEGGELLGCDLLQAVRARADEASSSSDPTDESTERHAKPGRIGDAETGSALGRAVVELPDLGILAVSDPAGRFELPGLPAGTHTLRAMRAGYEPVEGELEVPGEEELLVLLTPLDPEEQATSGRIIGRVRESGGGALSAVEVTVLGRTESPVGSDAQGRFLLEDLDPGLVEVRLTRLGYAPRTATLVAQPGRTVELNVTMTTEPIELDPIEVTVRSRFLEQNGFYRRAERTWGSHFTRQDLEDINLFETSDIVYRVSGVRLVRGRDGFSSYAASRRTRSISQGACILPVYVDGVRMFDADLDQITPDEIEAMEVYAGIGTPAEYASGGNSCGAVVIWSRRAGAGR